MINDFPARSFTGRWRFGVMAQDALRHVEDVAHKPGLLDFLQRKKLMADPAVASLGSAAKLKDKLTARRQKNPAAPQKLNGPS